jgi:hypothetical protein
VPTRDQVEELLGAGHSYETAARELGIAPGLARMIATGRPGDGVDVPVHNPTTSATVMEWVRGRAARQLTRPPGGAK